MIRVELVEPTTDDWKRWRTAAEKATKKLIEKAEAGERPRINESLYKRQRQALLDAFHGKCAYCEAKIILDQTGDIDHFRPKAGVTDENDAPVEIDVEGARKPHPGYYWLAYHWANLLPTCARCNRPQRTRDGRLVGKGTRFPVEQSGKRAAAPGTESTEPAVFLHPIFDNPEEHLGMAENGVLFGLTPRGQACIELLDLNREGLPEARRDVYTGVLARVARAGSAAAERPEQVLEDLKKLTAYKLGHEEYSCAGRKALRDLPGGNVLIQLAALLGGG